MISVSLCMIVKNEEAVLERCLKNAGKFADEIILSIQALMIKRRRSHKGIRIKSMIFHGGTIFLPQEIMLWIREAAII